MSLRLRVLTDPAIAGAVRREEAALRRWVAPERRIGLRERLRREAAYIAAHRATNGLLRTRPGLDPLSPSPEVPQ